MTVLKVGEGKTVNRFSMRFLWSRPTRDSSPAPSSLVHFPVFHGGGTQTPGVKSNGRTF